MSKLESMQEVANNILNKVPQCLGIQVFNDGYTYFSVVYPKGIDRKHIEECVSDAIEDYFSITIGDCNIIHNHQKIGDTVRISFTVPDYCYDRVTGEWELEG